MASSMPTILKTTSWPSRLMHQACRYSEDRRHCVAAQAAVVELEHFATEI